MEACQQARPAKRSQVQPQPKVSCLRCREQKLKCSRELPSCVRCLKHNIDCTYPAPPDRKRIAQRVSEAKASRANADNRGQLREDQAFVSNAYSRYQLAKPEHNDVGADPDPQYESDSTCRSDISETADLPSTEVGLLLLEVYFKRIYNATLMFHKAIFFDLYRQDAIPIYLLRAIFAHAAVFLQDVDTPHISYIKTLAMQSVYQKSWSWARSASKDVLSHADEPTLDRVQTLEILQLYYFSRGEVKRCKIHLHLAYKLTQLLGYPNLRECTTPEISTPLLMFEREMKRRCYWAIWCSVSLGEPWSNFDGIRDEVVGLPLPAKLECNGLVPPEKLNTGPAMRFDWESNSSTTPNSSTFNAFMPELIKSLGVWTNVKDFVSELPYLSPAEHTNRFERLAARADAVRRSSGLTVANLCVQAEAYQESPELLISVHSVHILNQLLLHIAMVSKLVKTPLKPFGTINLAQKCSRMALEFAGTFSNLLQLLFKENLDLSRIWPLTGYGAFMVANVFIIYKHETLQSAPRYHPLHVPELASPEMKTIQTVMEVSGTFWKPLRRYVTKFKQALSTESFGDLHSLISSTYPWHVGTTEPPQESTGDDDAFRANLRSVVTQSQIAQDLMPFEHHHSDQQQNLQCVDAVNVQAVLDQQVPWLADPITGSFHPDLLDFGLPTADGSIFTNNAENSLAFEPDWWGTTPADRHAEL